MLFLLVFLVLNIGLGLAGVSLTVGFVFIGVSLLILLDVWSL